MYICLSRWMRDFWEKLVSFIFSIPGTTAVPGTLAGPLKTIKSFRGLIFSPIQVQLTNQITYYMNALHWNIHLYHLPALNSFWNMANIKWIIYVIKATQITKHLKKAFHTPALKSLVWCSDKNSEFLGNSTPLLGLSSLMNVLTMQNTARFKKESWMWELMQQSSINWTF